MSSAARPALRIGLAGLGTVGASVLRIVNRRKAALERELGREVVITAIAARDRTRDRGVDVSGLDWHEDAVALARSPAIDCFVELMGGAEGAAKIGRRGRASGRQGGRHGQQGASRAPWRGVGGACRKQGGALAL